MAAFDFDAWQQKRDRELERRMHSLFDHTWQADTVYSPRNTSREEQHRIYEGYLPFWREAMKETHLHLDFPTYMSESMIRPRGSTTFCSRLCRYEPTVMHEHEFFEFNFQIGGDCAHFIRDQQIMLKEGDILLIPPGTRHQSAMLDDSCTNYSVGISSTHMPQILSHIWKISHPLMDYIREKRESVSRRSYALLHLDPEGVRSILRPLVVEKLDMNDPYFTKLGEIIIERIVTELLRRCTDVTLIEDDPEEMRNENAILYYINTHFKTVTRKELAAQFSYSERQISRLLLKSTGMSLTDYISEVRMKYVADMLISTKIPVHEIIEAAGYQNNNYFYQLFRDRFETTPLDYRAAHWMEKKEI